MNICEGTGGLRRSGLWIALVPLSADIFLLCRTALFAPCRPGTFDPGTLNPGTCNLDPLNLEMIALAIPGALLWLTGSILERFAKEAS